MTTPRAPHCPTCRDRGVFDRWSIEHTSARRFDEPDEHDCDGEETVRPGVPYWIEGRPIVYLSEALDVSRIAHVERSACSACVGGPSAYRNRAEARADRRAAKAEALRATAEADAKASLALLPPWGEPIKVDHHSAARHRRNLERSHDLMGRAVKSRREADRLERLADRPVTEISSDDPAAPAMLRGRATEHAARRDRLKAKNRADRKAGREPTYPSFTIRNMTANIRRMRKRADEIEATRAAAREPIEVGPWRMTWDSDANRVRIYGPAPGSAEVRKTRSRILRGAGFRWARSSEAWQRKISDAAWSSGLSAMAELDANAV